MRKILKLIGIFNFCLVSNSTVIACASDHYISASFSEIKGANGWLNSLTHDKNNIFVSSTNGSVYKSNGNDNFQEMSGTNEGIKHLVSDNSNNLYAAGGWDNFYIATKDSMKFNSIYWRYGEVTFLSKDNKDGAWAGSQEGVFWCSGNSSNPDWQEKNIFHSIGTILDLKVNKYGVIYLLNDQGEVFKCFDSDDASTLKLIWKKAGMTNLLIDDSNNVYTRGRNEIYQSDGDNNFKKIYSSSNSIKNWIIGDSSELYFITNDNKIYKLSSSNNNDNFDWNEIRSDKKIEGNFTCLTLFESYDYIYPILFLSTDQGKVYSTSI